MNLIGMMVAVSLMSIGALGALYLLIGPPIALSRLSAQTEADAIVERFHWEAWCSKNVEPTYSPGLTEPTGLTLDCTGVAIPATIPANCSLKKTSDRNQAVVITCAGQNTDPSSYDGRYRRSSAVLIGAGAKDEKFCESDLFPVPCP